jgi:hypothetical protein
VSIVARGSGDAAEPEQAPIQAHQHDTNTNLASIRPP